MAHVVKLTSRGNALGVNLPRALLSELKWRPADLLVIEAHDGSLVIRELELARTGLARRPRHEAVAAEDAHE